MKVLLWLVFFSIHCSFSQYKAFNPSLNDENSEIKILRILKGNFTNKIEKIDGLFKEEKVEIQTEIFESIQEKFSNNEVLMIIRN